MLVSPGGRTLAGGAMIPPVILCADIDTLRTSTATVTHAPLHLEFLQFLLTTVFLLLFRRRLFRAGIRSGCGLIHRLNRRTWRRSGFRIPRKPTLDNQL